MATDTNKEQVSQHFRKTLGCRSQLAKIIYMYMTRNKHQLYIKQKMSSVLAQTQIEVHSLWLHSENSILILMMKQNHSIFIFNNKMTIYMDNHTEVYCQFFNRQ